jgi:hypothetical protein
MAASPPPYDGPLDIKHPEKIKEFELTGPYNEETGEYIPLPDDPHESGSTSSNPPAYSPSVIYSDKHVIIDSATKTLTIKHFIILNPTQHISIPKLLYVRPVAEVTKTIEIKCWGIGVTGILWARDFGRAQVMKKLVDGDVHLGDYFVVKVEGDWLRSGFTVEDPKRFLEALESVESGVTARQVPTKERGHQCGDEG